VRRVISYYEPSVRIKTLIDVLCLKESVQGTNSFDTFYLSNFSSLNGSNRHTEFQVAFIENAGSKKYLSHNLKVITFNKFKALNVSVLSHQRRFFGSIFGNG